MLKLAVASGALEAEVERLAKRLARTTRRERLLLGALAAAALIYAPVAALDWRSSQEDRYVDALILRAQARAGEAQAAQLARDAQDAAVLEDMNSWGFEAGNIAVARIALEQRIVDSATDANLTNLRITTQEDIEALGPVSWLGADVQADLRWGATFDFLDHLGGWPEGFRVTRFSYELSAVPMLRPVGSEGGMPPPIGRVSIGIAAPVELTNGADGTP